MANGSVGSMLLVRTNDTNIRVIFLITISERKVVPCAVLLVSGIYAAVAAIFYFE